MTTLDEHWADSIEQGVHAFRLEIERLENIGRVLEFTLQLAVEALEFCATNDFKIEKTQNVAREALKKIRGES